MYSLHWFREDLRLDDNTSLFHAASQAPCMAIYVITPKTWQQHAMAGSRVDFILRGLSHLQTELGQLNIPLFILQGEDFANLPALILNFCQQYQISTLHFNLQYEINEIKRDTAVKTLLTAQGIKVFSYHDQTILPPQLIRTQTNAAFKVFTPFKKAWIHSYRQVSSALLPKPKAQKPLLLPAPITPIPAMIPGFKSLVAGDVWPAGEDAARQRLHFFSSHIVNHYHEWRDFPALDGTSKLSPYLTAGMISARQCLYAALELNHGELEQGAMGIVQWINELIWREFYKTILVNFPRVSMHQPFKLNTNNLHWDTNETYLTAWQCGQTGFPIIDAGMRQLQTLGWMHNRVRMIVAMFFCKQLWLDWRLGEQFFMQHLIDGDLAANNGGWQWCASTGNDAAPYFRIFNPTTQSQRFDPEGKFIRRFCPELQHLDNDAIHQPHAFSGQYANLNYPYPIVDYKQTRARAIAAFKMLSPEGTP